MTQQNGFNMEGTNNNQLQSFGENRSPDLKLGVKSYVDSYNLGKNSFKIEL